jgi:hypothetical protein
MFEQAFKNIDDVLWKEAGCTTELDYTEQTSWLLVRGSVVSLSRLGRCSKCYRANTGSPLRSERLHEDSYEQVGHTAGT